MFGLCAIYTIVTILVSIIGFYSATDSYYESYYDLHTTSDLYVTTSLIGWSTFPAFGLVAAIFCLLGANADYPEIHMTIHFILVRKIIFQYVLHICCSDLYLLFLEYSTNPSLCYPGPIFCRRISIYNIR